MSALTKLAERVEHGVRAGLLPREWGDLAQAAIAEAEAPWEPEPAFRARTGKTLDWCRRHFAEYVSAGLARGTPHAARRFWHRDAAPDRPGRTPAAIKREIVESFR